MLPPLFAYAVHDRIQVRGVNTDAWRDAIVTRLAPNHGRPGYYMMYDPLPRDGVSVGGGWTYEACMRPRSAALAA